MGSLKKLDWREKVDCLSNQLITSANTDQRYSAGEDLLYQKNTIRKIYRDSANWGDFSVDAMLCDIEDHDSEILEKMAELIMANCLLNPDEIEDTYEDIKCNIIGELAETYETDVFIEFPITGNSSMPYIVSRELALNKWYYEIQYPPFGHEDFYQGHRQRIGYNDCQNVLFKQMVRFDIIYDIIDDTVINVPIQIRPQVKRALKIGGKNNGYGSSSKNVGG